MTRDLRNTDIHALEEEARRLRAEAMANGVKAIIAWFRAQRRAHHGQTA